LPEVTLPLPDFAAVCDQLKTYDLALFFYECGGVPLRSLLPGDQARPPRKIALITGSEGGFSPQEAAAAAAAGAVAVGLGPRILLPGAQARPHRKIPLIPRSEGGSSPQEAAAAAAAGAVAVGLGPRILRCETAPLAVLSAVMTLTGNLE